MLKLPLFISWLFHAQDLPLTLEMPRMLLEIVRRRPVVIGRTPLSSRDLLSSVHVCCIVGYTDTVLNM